MRRRPNAPQIAFLPQAGAEGVRGDTVEQRSPGPWKVIFTPDTQSDKHQETYVMTRLRVAIAQRHS